MSFTAVQQRWETFRSTIETRFQELLEESEAVLPTLLEQSGFDTMPFINAWQGAYRQAQELVFRIEGTWGDKVSSAFEAVSDDTVAFREAFQAEQEKGAALAFALEKQLRRYEVRITAEAARRLWKHAQETLAKEFACTECRAPLPVRPDFFRAYHLTCDYCQRVNTFEPGTLARNVEHFALHPLAEEKALESYLAFMDLERKVRHTRGEPSVALRAELEAAFRGYAEIYLRTRGEIFPEYQKRYEQDLAAKMDGFRRSAS